MTDKKVYCQSCSNRISEQCRTGGPWCLIKDLYTIEETFDHPRTTYVTYALCCIKNQKYNCSDYMPIE